MVMARLIRSAHRALFTTSSSSTLLRCIRLHEGCNFCNHLTHQSQTRHYATTTSVTKSPIKDNILRILRNEITNQLEYTPPHEPAARFNSFVVEDRPGEQWIIMTRNYDSFEDIKIEVTMFDGLELVPKHVDDDAEDARLHISLLVDISKKDTGTKLEFVCSAWPDCLEIQKLYVLKQDKLLTNPYMGPDFPKLNRNLQKSLRAFLEARGINNELSAFLHEYMMNKDRIELIKWLGKLKSFMEK